MDLDKLPNNFFNKYIEEPNTGCWIWLVSLNTGYGSFRYPKGEPGLAYKYAYETLIGAIPENKELHHRCENTLCVNPQHLEVVTHRENMRKSVKTIAGKNIRKTHCGKGHEYTKKNTRKYHGSRICKECSRQALRDFRDRLKINH